MDLESSSVLLATLPFFQTKYTHLTRLLWKIAIYGPFSKFFATECGESYLGGLCMAIMCGLCVLPEDKIES